VSDGVPRLSVYSQISDLPIVVAVGQATADIYAQWRRYAWIIGALIAALTAMTGALAWFLLRELNWHRDAQQHLATLASTDGLTGPPIAGISTTRSAASGAAQGTTTRRSRY
jgi:hypothetical protein